MYKTYAENSNIKDPGHRWWILQIGLTDYCNLMCLHCPRIFNQKYVGTMSLHDFKKYLSCFSPDWFMELTISDFGEITIIKNLVKYFYIINKKGWSNVSFVTNAKRYDAFLWEEIISKRLLSKLTISLEAATPKLYEAIRGNKFKNFFFFITEINKLIRKYKSPLKVFFSVVSFKTNLNEFPDIIRLASDLNIDQVTFVHLNAIDFKDNNPSNKLCTPDQHLDKAERKKVIKTFGKAIALAEKNNIKINLPEQYREIAPAKKHSNRREKNFKNLLCEAPLNWVQVSLSGDIFPCCQMGKKYLVGNLNRRDFHGIWNNVYYKRLLDGLQPDGKPLNVCKKCNVFNGKNF